MLVVAATIVLTLALAYLHLPFDEFVAALKFAVVLLAFLGIVSAASSAVRQEEEWGGACNRQRPLPATADPNPARLGKLFEYWRRSGAVAKAVSLGFAAAAVADIAAWAVVRGGVEALLRPEVAAALAAVPLFYIFFIPAILHRIVVAMECRPIAGPILTAAIPLAAAVYAAPYILLSASIELFIP